MRVIAVILALVACGPPESERVGYVLLDRAARDVGMGLQGSGWAGKPILPLMLHEDDWLSLELPTGAVPLSPRSGALAQIGPQGITWWRVPAEVEAEALEISGDSAALGRLSDMVGGTIENSGENRALLRSPDLLGRVSFLEVDGLTEAKPVLTESASATASAQVDGFPSPAQLAIENRRIRESLFEAARSQSDATNDEDPEPIELLDNAVIPLPGPGVVAGSMDVQMHFGGCFAAWKQELHIEWSPQGGLVRGTLDGLHPISVGPQAISTRQALLLARALAKDAQREMDEDTFCRSTSYDNATLDWRWRRVDGKPVAGHASAPGDGGCSSGGGYFIRRRVEKLFERLLGDRFRQRWDTQGLRQN
jgi:hypothetical protein